MTSGLLQCLLAGCVIAAIAGCGGSSTGGGGSTGGGDTPATVTFAFKGASPTAVAARIGSGTFSTSTLKGGVLTLSVPSGTTNFTVAYVCSLVSGQVQLPMEFVFELSTADGTNFTGVCPSYPAGQTGMLTTSVDASAIPGANEVDLAATNGSVFSLTGAVLKGSYNFSAPAGNDRVEVLAYQANLVGTVATTSLVAARNLTNQTVPGALNGGSMVILGAADETTSQSITYSNLPSGYAAPSTSVGLGLGDAGGFAIAGPASNQYPVLPAEAVQNGDFYEFFASAANASKPTEEVIVAKNTQTPEPMTFAFPAPWIYAGPTPAALPNFNFAYTGFTGKTGVMETASIGWSSGVGPESFIGVSATANYQNGSTSLVIPDLSAITGFLRAPSSGTPVVWTAEIVQDTPVLLPASLADSGGPAVVNGGNYTVP